MKFLGKIYCFVGLIGVLFFSSCSDYLDVSSEVQENLTIDEVFENPTYMREWHRNIFNCISQYSMKGSGAYTGFTGIWCHMNGELVMTSGNISDIMTSGFDATNARVQRWGGIYEYIRQGMIFLGRAKPLGGDHDQTQLTEEEIRRMKAEVKYLIAYSYFSLFELYGPVPVVEEIADPNDKNIDYERLSVDEIISYIDVMLEEVIQSGDLPETLVVNSEVNGNNRYNLNEIVRPTKLVAMALRAKLWVYAASPLFNGKYEESLDLKNTDGKALFAAYDANKWVIAKKHLEEFLDFAHSTGHGLYFAKPTKNEDIDPNQSIYELFQYYNDEIIWATGVNSYNGVADEMENNTNPRDLYNGWCNVAPSQEAVDAFFCNDGLCIDDPNSVYKDSGFSDVVNVCNEAKKVDKNIYNMYANREPRFYASVVYEGKSWHKQPTNRPEYTVCFSKGSGNDNSKAASPKTGYLLYKFKNRQLLNTGNNLKKWGRPNILFRLADFYLYYAEVCNEINPNDPNIILYLDKIRERAGIPGYRTLAATGKKNIIGNQEIQRKAIRQERYVEFYAEGQRYFDIRRWMICGEGEEADQTIVHGLDMNGQSGVEPGKQGSFYRRVVVENRAWRRSMYLYPIPYSEIQKSRRLVQNPLW
nr:RagB/SusD family nutrient uptake outer membrane protein [Parabacteroides goldsteinii]